MNYLLMIDHLMTSWQSNTKSSSKFHQTMSTEGQRKRR